MMQVFPIESGRTDYESLFIATHQGVDIFAPRGAPVVAVAAGQARTDVSSKGGNVVYLVEPDKTQYYYAHLDTFTGPFPREVAPGEQLGTVGTTGNAQGKEPHVHFEVRPQGGDKVDPAPLLDSIGLTKSPQQPRRSTATQKTPVKSGSPMVGLLILFGLWMMSRGKRGS